MSEFESTVLKYRDTGDSYIYPNRDSVSANRDASGRVQLQRGMLWSMTSRQVAGGTYEWGSGGMPTMQTVNTKVYKKFQYNPSDVRMRMNAVAVDPPSSENDAGNLHNLVQGMGALQMELKLFFSRDQEVYVATNERVNRTGIGNLSGTVNRDALEVYRRIGVQKDVYDLYRVILAYGVAGAGDVSYATENTQTLPDDMTLSGLTKKAFDLASAGSFLLQMPVAVQINKDAIFYGFITSMDVAYTKFNYNMVPLWANVALGLDVTNVRPSSAPPATVFGGGLANGAGGDISGTRDNSSTSPTPGKPRVAPVSIGSSATGFKT